MEVKEPTQEQIKEYIEGTKNLPLRDGQLLEMVILHFNIPQQIAERAIWEVIHGDTSH